ncbi:MAG TPA: hypothetical protein VEA69_11665, partial [Tepidisphaeraceae bacterium]|nr:hypothetical protein [Tepidisphaeraceae bacterium]
ERKPAGAQAYPLAAGGSVSTTPPAASPLVATAWVGDFGGLWSSSFAPRGRNGVFADELIETIAGAVY